MELSPKFKNSLEKNKTNRSMLKAAACRKAVKFQGISHENKVNSYMQSILICQDNKEHMYIM